MSTHYHRLIEFFRELRRRKVIQVITVYAAASFIVLELVDILAPSLRLPEWTLNLVLMLLCVGFVIAVIVSWIYDIHPEGGIVKTEPAHKLKPEDIPKSSNSWKIASYVSFVVIVGLIVLNIIPRNKKTEILDKSIAVLPFQNLSDEAGNEHFVDGLVEDLLNKISVIEELRVTSRTSSDMYRERGTKSISEIADELNVSYILEGSVQRYREKARITVQLIDAVHDDHIWTENYDRELLDVFKIQSEIAMKIATELDAILTSEQKSIIQEAKTSNIKAFELYQVGRFYWNKRTDEGFLKAIPYFEQAIETDPGYGLAFAGLADTYYLMALRGIIDREEGSDTAVQLALRALELDGNLAEAYTVLGGIYDYIYWDWGNAEDAFQNALELNSNYSTAHQYYAEHLTFTGRHDEARMHIGKAVELNPLSFVIRHINGRIYYAQGNFEEALREFNISEDIQKGHEWTYLYRYLTYYQLDRVDQAFNNLIGFLAFTPRYDLEVAEQIYQESGLREVIMWIIEDDIAAAAVEEPHYYLEIAGYLALLGRDEEALDWLGKAFLARQTTMVNFYYPFRSLHGHPRFQAILEGMGLGDQLTL